MDRVGLFEPTTSELRVTVVGQSIFAVKLNLKSEKALYEDIHLCTSEDDIFHRAISARGKFVNIRDRILTLMNEFGLVYGSIDLIIDKNDPMVFLEVNPSGDWAYIEERTGLPITQTITNLIRAETTLCVVLDE
jgi:hypothetical protein